MAGSEREADAKHSNQNHLWIKVDIANAKVKRWPCERLHTQRSGPSLDSRAQQENWMLIDVLAHGVSWLATL